MLKIQNLEAGYGKLRVLRTLSMHVNEGEIVTIIGANGAGKTTLLHAIAGLVPPISGTIQFRDNSIGGYSPEKIVYRGCSLVPEGRQVFPTLTVRENLTIGGFVLSRRREKKEIAFQMEEIFTLFPRLKERQQQLAGTLSGGEQQMLAIGRSLMGKPDLIMMDEPSMGLAPLIIKDIFSAIVRLQKLGKTILLIEQNARAALTIASRGYVLETGVFITEGSSEDLLHDNEVQRAYLGKEYQSIADTE